MARQVLENGVILPAEYSDDWYDDMTSNLTKLDDVIGSDSEKLSSSDVGAAALSNNYNDLDNLPTIPTVNDATLTIQKNGSTVKTFTANASSNVTCNITVPTKTSDLTNDSNFVDTSNSAVASGITSAKVSDYDTHIADTDIHVTTADKNRWNNNTYVFRYSSTALTPSSTNSNALLDNTDNLKVGDKVIDSSGVLFSVTAIDTANSTFSIGTALIDLAQDSDVVHKSGDETISGEKTFTDVITNNITNKVNAYITLKNSSYDPKTNGQSNANSGSFSIGFNTLTDDSFAWISAYGLPEYSLLRLTTTYFTDSENSITDSIEYKIYQNGDRTLRPRNNNNCMLGETSRRWSKIYGTEYYYGSDNTEFSTKFVTTDTAQTISGAKTFSSNVNVYNSDSTASIPNLILKNSKAEKGGVLSENQVMFFVDKLNRTIASLRAQVGLNGQSFLLLRADNLDSSDNPVYCGISFSANKDGTKIVTPNTNGDTDFGISTAKWKSFNGLEPSSLSLPSGNLNDVIDISSYLSNLDGTNNTYVAPANGWIAITMSNSSGIQAYINGLWGHQIVRPTAGGIRFLMPILKDKTVNILIFGGTIDNARFILCQGNV